LQTKQPVCHKAGEPIRLVFEKIRGLL